MSVNMGEQSIGTTEKVAYSEPVEQEIKQKPKNKYGIYYCAICKEKKGFEYDGDNEFMDEEGCLCYCCDDCYKKEDFEFVEVEA